MTARNVNGGIPCRMTEAKGYAPKRGTPRKELLISGIYSHAAEWEGFEYNEDDVSAAHGVPMPAFTEYRPVGMIKQAPACRVDYKGKGPAGGRKCPRTYMGAAHRHMKHSESVKVYFSISDDAITLMPRLGHG